MTEVYISPNGRTNKKVYHTDPDCKYVKNPDLLRSKSRSVIPDHRECRGCSGADYEARPDGSHRSHYKSLLAAAGDP